MKFSFLFLFCVTMGMTCFSASPELTMLVGTYTNGKTDVSGIMVYRFNEETGDAVVLSETNGLKNPTFLTLSKDGKKVYAVEESGKSSAVKAFSFDKKSGVMTFLNSEPTIGADPCNIAAGKDFVVTANYGGGSVTQFPLNKDGSIGKAVQVIQFEGTGPVKSRQEKPHLHCVILSPDGKYVFANDLGTDHIYRLDLSDPKGKTGKTSIRRSDADVQLPGGEGPRHLTFHPNGKYAYLIGELSGNVTAFRYDKGSLNAFQTLVADTLKAAGSADIHVTPDGKFLYASNRLKGDGLAIFKINPDNGSLAKVGYQPTGIHPRNFAITPNGNYLLCANRDSGMIQVFAIDPKTGLLTDTGKNILLKRPVCIRFCE